MATGVCERVHLLSELVILLTATALDPRVTAKLCYLGHPYGHGEKFPLSTTERKSDYDNVPRQHAQTTLDEMQVEDNKTVRLEAGTTTRG